MNISPPLGLGIGALIVYYGISNGIKNSDVFLNPHAGTIVIGGTLAVAFIMFSMKDLYNLVKMFFQIITGNGRRKLQIVIDEIVEIAVGLERGQEISTRLSSIKNPFLRESLMLVEERAFGEHELKSILIKRLEIQNERYKRLAQTYKILGKFPPAFGLLGTTLGMVGLLQSLGQPDSFQKVGPAMSIALVATFYGLVLSNVIIIPVGENLTEASSEDLIMRRIVVDGVILLKERRHPLHVKEFLKSYLTPSERNSLKT